MQNPGTLIVLINLPNLPSLATREKKLKGQKLIFLCNLWMEIDPPYLIWKLRMSPFICHMVAWSAPTGCRVTDQNVEDGWQTPGRPQNMVIKYLSVGQMSKFIYQQIALDVLFQMRYDSLPNSNKQPSDSLKAEATPVFTSKQDCFAYYFARLWGSPLITPGQPDSIKISEKSRIYQIKLIFN